MTDQELADAILARFVEGSGLHAGVRVGDLLDFVDKHRSPSPIDRVSGWSVHVDANGHRFAVHVVRGRVHRERNFPNGIDVYGVLHPWPA